VQLEILAAQLTSVRTLLLNDCHSISSKGIKQLVRTVLSGLRMCQLPIKRRSTDPRVHAFTRLGSRRIPLSLIPIRWTGVQVQGCHASLTWLSLAHCKLVSSDSLLWMAGTLAHGAAKLRRLKYLDVSSCEQVGHLSTESVAGTQTQGRVDE
jgi:hypothetical protein